MTYKHLQYLFYSFLSFVLSAFGFANMLDVRGHQNGEPTTYFGIIFCISGIYFLSRFMKERFK